MVPVPLARAGGPLVMPPTTVGGCDFFADPDRSADEAPIFWRPEFDPATVILEKCLAEAPGTILFRASAWRGELISQSAADGLHLILVDGGSEHRLWMPERPMENTPLATVIPLNVDAETRAAASIRFYRHIAGAKPSFRHWASRQRQERLALSLRALDGHLDGAAYRTIAEALFGSVRAGAEPWRTASLRDNTIRLVRTGKKLMAGGYRDLLRGRTSVR